MGIIGIAELIEQLLLHVVAHHTFVGNGTPQVLVPVDIDNAGYGLNTHAGKDLFHVAFKTLRLWMIYTVAGSRFY